MWRGASPFREANILGLEYGARKKQNVNEVFSPPPFLFFISKASR